MAMQQPTIIVDETCRYQRTRRLHRITRIENDLHRCCRPVLFLAFGARAAILVVSDKVFLDEITRAGFALSYHRHYLFLNRHLRAFFRFAFFLATCCLIRVWPLTEPISLLVALSPCGFGALLFCPTLAHDLVGAGVAEEFRAGAGIANVGVGHAAAFVARSNFGRARDAVDANSHLSLLLPV